MSSVVVNNYLENRHSHGRKSSAFESKFSKRKKQIVIFADSIPGGIRLLEFNYRFHKGYAQFKSFPGGTSKLCGTSIVCETNIEKQKIRRGFTACWC